ncbi:MAG TPA: hypothetical protein VFN51_01420 [Candidatus Saccharimonadales bacterium]|nr:hypothetical protein [Candidatus Saccharimonadales bacterium]
MLPDEPDNEEAQEKLPEDYDTPFRPADPTRETDLEADDDAQPAKGTDDTRPETDSDVQKEELYDAGIAKASSIDDPKNGGVVGYTPPVENDDAEEDPA